jgi:hypothetical protein
MSSVGGGELGGVAGNGHGGDGLYVGFGRSEYGAGRLPGRSGRFRSSGSPLARRDPAGTGLVRPAGSQRKNQNKGE